MIRSLQFPPSGFHKVFNLYLEKNDDFDIASRVKKCVKSSKIELFGIILK